MYDHPLASYFPPTKETNNEAVCNSWGYISNVTHAYFEEDNLEAGEHFVRFMANSKCSPIRQRRLIRTYKKYKTVATLREIQCLVANAAEEEIEQAMLQQADFVSLQLPEADEDCEDEYEN